MENVYFLYNNYHYIMAAYGYYKVASNGYDNVEKGVKFYNFCSGTYYYAFPNKIKQDWEEIEIKKKYLEPIEEINIIEEDDNEWINITTEKKEEEQNMSKSCIF